MPDFRRDAQLFVAHDRARDVGARIVRFAQKQQAEGSHKPHKNIKIYSAVLVAAALTIGQAQAGGRGSPNLGASSFAPGHGTPVVGDPGKSGNAPGDIKNDKGLKDEGREVISAGRKEPEQEVTTPDSPAAWRAQNVWAFGNVSYRLRPTAANRATAP